MLRFHSSRFGWVLALTFGLWAPAAPAQEFRYHYVSIGDAVLPPGIVFLDPVAINNRGLIPVTAWECRPADTCDEFIPHVGVYAGGAVTVLQPGLASAVNEGGTIGGSVLIDPVNFTTQAALFRGKSVELIPPQPGEYTSSVIRLNDKDVALVASDDAFGQRTYVLFSKGHATTLHLGTTPVSLSGINNEGIISGITGDLFDGARGLRFNPRTGQATLLNPFPGDATETLAWGVGINNSGNVLGYSFTFRVQPYHERIGLWDRNGQFKTYSVSPINTSRLRFNDNNLIVASLASNTQTSYLIPRPGVRFDLADLVDNLPPGRNLVFVIGLNNRGDILGGDFFSNYFLLQRIDAAAPQTLAASRPASRVKGTRHMPPKAAAFMRNLLPSIEELK